VLPLREAEKAARDLFRPALDALAEAEDHLKGRIISHRAGMRDVRAEALRLAATGDAVALEVAEEARAAVPDRVPGVTFRRKVEGEVVDLEALPDTYVVRVANTKALLAATKEADGDPGIPGWRGRITETAAVSNTGKGVI